MVVDRGSGAINQTLSDNTHNRARDDNAYKEGTKAPRSKVRVPEYTVRKSSTHWRGDGGYFGGVLLEKRKENWGSRLAAYQVRFLGANFWWKIKKYMYMRTHYD